MNYGFIILRNVTSEKTNEYWNQSVKLLKTYYPNRKIIIIDDNSNDLFVKSHFEYKNVEIIYSEYKGRGELLPYIYYLKYKWFENAFIIHDSVFFHRKYDFEKIIAKDYKVLPLWFFYNNGEEIRNHLQISNHLNNNNNIKKHLINWKKMEWLSCFGAMCLINYNFLNFIDNKYNLKSLINVIKNRKDRTSLERIFGILFYIETGKNKNLFGCINENNIRSKYCNYTFDEYINFFNKDKKILSPIVKVWTGR